jgi:hypothetical protein
MGRIIPYIMENKKSLKPPTSTRLRKWLATIVSSDIHKWDNQQVLRKTRRVFEP